MPTRTSREPKTLATLIIILWLGLCPQLSFAGAAAPLSTPVLPAQSSSTAALGFEPASLEIMEVKEAVGDVAIKRQGDGLFQNIQRGSVLHIGDTMRSGDGSCHLLIDGKSEVYVGPRTLLRINEASRNNRDKTNSTKLNLESGKLKVMLDKLNKGSTFQVTTPTAIAAVRGTVFYLNAGIFHGQNSTQLYVDESHGGVNFKNTITGEWFIVPAFSMSNSFADGQLNAPRQLSSEQRDAFVKQWVNPGSQPSQQFGVEEIPNPAAASSSDEADLADENAGPATNDAAQDRISEQNIPGSNGLQAPSAPSRTIDNTEPKSDPQGGSSIDDQEKAMIRQEIARIRTDQDFDHADANLARISDAQKGKVFTDVFGNRVRVDQYIFHEPDSDVVQLLSLTARTGEYQQGVSSIRFGAQFNRSLGSDVNLKSLPWNDYMNVVKKDEVAARLGIPQNSPAYDSLFNEYIIHEHAPGLAQGPSEIFPVHFFAQFTNPIGKRAGGDLILFDDFYTAPFPIDLRTDQGLQSFMAQGQAADSVFVQPFQGTGVLLEFNYLTGQQTIKIGEGEPQPFTDSRNSGSSGSQTAAFAANFDPSKLLDINFYRTLAANHDSNPNNDEFPSYFDNRLDERLGAESAVIGRNHVIGGFIPINDQGQIINHPGFRIYGLRDLLNPNPLVNGGDYNLEVVLMYGYVGNHNGPQEGLFYQDFRIDTIITPEIFQSFESELDHSPSLFAADRHANDAVPSP